MPSKHCSNAYLRLARVYHCMTCRTYKNPSQGERKNALQEVPPLGGSSSERFMKVSARVGRTPSEEPESHQVCHPKTQVHCLTHGVSYNEVEHLDLTLSKGAKPQCYVGNIPVALMGKLFLWSPPSGSEELLKPLALYTMNKSAIRCRTNTERQTTICCHVHKRL